MADETRDPATADYVDRQREMWGLADYPALADRLAPAARTLVELAAPGPGTRVLDVAAGTGTVALLAAGRGAEVTACDLAPRMVELGSRRTADAGVAVRWFEADVEDLPLPAEAADLVLSSFGVIFAPRPAVALRELHRVLRPGGRLAFTAWTPDGFMGAMADLIRRWVGAPPEVPDPVAWARPELVHDWLHDAGFAVRRVSTSTLPWRFDSGAEMTRFFREHSPAHAALEQARGADATALFTAIERLANPDGGPVALDAEFVTVVSSG